MNFPRFFKSATIQDCPPAKAAKRANPLESGTPKLATLARLAAPRFVSGPTERPPLAETHTYCALAEALDLVADAIAAVPRSPFLNELALSKAAACFIAAERSSQAAPASLRVEICNLAAEAMTLAAYKIRRSDYQAAYEAFQALTGKLRDLRVQ
jgi:hypothetical protein